MSDFPEYIEMAGKPAEFDIREESTPPTMDGIAPIQKYVRLDLVQKQIEEAVKKEQNRIAQLLIDEAKLYELSPRAQDIRFKTFQAIRNGEEV